MLPGLFLGSRFRRFPRQQFHAGRALQSIHRLRKSPLRDGQLLGCLSQASLLDDYCDVHEFAGIHVQVHMVDGFARGPLNAGYSTFAPVSLTSFAQRAMSSLTKAPNSSGELPIGSKPKPAMRVRTSG